MNNPISTGIDSKNDIPNPITLAFSLGEGHQDLLRSTLQGSGLEPSDIDHILNNINDIGVENKLLFSLNRKYKSHSLAFDEFVSQRFGADFLKSYYSSTPSKKRIHHLYAHQTEGIDSILSGTNTVIATGTGSGKTETFLWPIVDYCLRHQGPGVKAIMIYPMNALANDQLRRIGDLVEASNLNGASVSYGAFTGSTPENESNRSDSDSPLQRREGQLLYREEFRNSPPDILLTNYVMLDHILTKDIDREILLSSAETISHLVFDELHTYRGNKATHLRGLILRLRSIIRESTVYVGTSATLISPKALPDREAARYQGYLGKVEAREVDEFIHPLFGTKPYKLVLPQYDESKVETQVQTKTIQVSSKSLGWKMGFDEEEGLANLSTLLSTEIKSSDLDKKGESPPRVVELLREDPFVHQLQESLMVGPQSIYEIDKILKGMISDQSIDTMELTKAYLSAIAFSNHYAEGDPLLDFRIHLFLRDIGGCLQMCVKCGRYFSGYSSSCDSCGWPLFKVYRKNVHQAVGKVSGSKLRSELRRESDDPELTFNVTLANTKGIPSVHIDPETSQKDESLKFKLDIHSHDTGISINYDPMGAIALSLISRDLAQRPQDLTIPLVSRTNNQQYLQHLLVSLLESQMSESKKILGFIDNREKASRHVAQLKEFFAAKYFLETLKFLSVEISSRSIDEAIMLAQKSVLAENLTQVEQDLFKREFPLWLSREMSIPKRSDKAGNLLKWEQPSNADHSDPRSFSTFELEIIELFFQERAIDKRFLSEQVPALAGINELDRQAYNYIKYGLGRAVQHHGVCFSGQRSTSRKYSAVVLSEQARIYRDFITKNGLDKIIEIIRELTDDGNHPELPFVAYNVSNDRSTQIIHYYLKHSWLKFNIEPSAEKNFNKLRKKYYLETELHNTDLDTEKRTEIESGFQDGKINFLLATSTLEMGIDIGALSTVMLVGAPPLPSSYAQRAGRAGRSSKNKYALIVNFFSESENHDSYYYDRPKELVSGYISPPVYNPNNVDVLKQHVNAFLLKDFLKGEFTLHELCDDLDNQLPIFKTAVGNVFPNAPGLIDYLDKDFPSLVNQIKNKAGRYGLSLKMLYGLGIFPDYGFRHDEVTVLDKDKLQADKSTEIHEMVDRGDYKSLAKFQITYRYPENAYYKLVPGESVYMAGDKFTIAQPDKNGENTFFHILTDDDGQETISHRILFGARSIDLKREYEIKKKYARSCRLIPVTISDTKTLGGILDVTYHSNSKLFFRNNGILRDAGEVDSSSAGTGCELKREGIAFSMPSDLSEPGSVFISFLSALDRAIKDLYGLDENDLKLQIDIQIPPREEDRIKAFLYDANGTGAIPFIRIMDELETEVGAIRRAFDRLGNCPNDKCEEGCYLCLRSYGTQYYASELNKSAALMMAGYLIENNPLTPDLPDVGVTRSNNQFLNLFLAKEDSDSIVAYTDESSYSQELTGQQNIDIYSVIAGAISKNTQTDQRGLRVIIPPEWAYLYDNLGGRKVGNKALIEEKLKFEELLFQFLRFDRVDVVMYENVFKEAIV